MPRRVIRAKAQHMFARYSLPLLVASFGLAGAFLAQGCSSTTNNGFGQESDSGKDVAVGPGLSGDGGGAETGIIGKGCGGGKAKTAKSPVFFEFVVDGSGSMFGTKKDAQEAALKAVFEQIRNDSCNQVFPNLCDGNKPADVKDNTQGVGMLFFGPSGTYPGPDDVNIGFVDNAQLAALFARVSKFPDGSTPTFEALTGGYKVLDNLVPFPPLPTKAKKVVILMSDGAPNSATGITQLVQQKAQQADPITTFSVYVGELSGSTTALKFMTDVALAGGTAPQGCDPTATNVNNFCHFQITPGAKTTQQVAQEFVAALNTIRGLASACELDITLVDKDGRPADPTKVNVSFVAKDDEDKIIKDIPKDGTNGWTYDDDENPTKIILHGSYCEEARANSSVTIGVQMGCIGGG